MDLSTLDDAALIAIIAGSRPADPLLNEAVGLLYDRYGRLVYTIAIRVVGDVETAEEVTQDVFVRVVDGASTFKPELAKASSWLVSIARHRAIDELRRRSSRPEKDSIDWPEEAGDSPLEGLPGQEDPVKMVEVLLARRSVRAMVAALPADQREVLGLAFYKGLSHSQIAELLGEPLGTVKSRIRLAMQKLREAMIERGMIDFP